MLTVVRRRPFAFAIGCTLLASALSLPASAAAPAQRVTFVLRRTGAGATSWNLNIHINNDHATGSFLGFVGARFERGKPVRADAAWAGSARRWEDTTLHLAGTTVSSCSAGVCHDDTVLGYQGLVSSYRDEGGDDAYTHFFLVATGRIVRYGFEGKGWTLVRMPLSFRYLDGGDTSPAHAHSGQTGAEVFTEASLPGGRHGSLGVGVPPCSFAAVHVAMRGVGRLTLDGGAKPETVVCPDQPKLLGSYATGPTTWRFHGLAAGDITIQDTRLFVVDLPARLP